MAFQPINLDDHIRPGEDPARIYEKSHTLHEKPLTSAERTMQNIFEEREEFRGQIVAERSKDFLNQFSWPDAEQKNKDWKRITDLRKTKTDPTDRSEVFANIVGRLSERAGWFGHDCEVTSTHEFDDVANGTDQVLTWYKQEVGGKKVIARLAVDCTLTEDKLDEKAEKIIKKIDDGELTNLRYFKSKRQGIMGPLKNLPRVIIRLKKSNLDEMCRMAVKEVSNLKTGSKEFRTYYIQLLFLLEIESQLRSQERYLKEREQEPEQKNKVNLQQLQKTIQNTRQVIAGLIQDKKSSLDATSVQRALAEFKHPFSYQSRLHAPDDVGN